MYNGAKRCFLPVNMDVLGCLRVDLFSHRLLEKKKEEQERRIFIASFSKRAFCFVHSVVGGREATFFVQAWGAWFGWRK